MANSAEPSSSISFTSSSHMSNGSISHHRSTSSGSEAGSNIEIFSLSKLSSNLEQLLVDSSCDYSDADIVVDGVSVGVHRCILASRSKFFSDLFKKEKGLLEKEGKPKYCMTDLLPYGKVGHEAFLIFLSYLYTGKLKPSPLEVSTCVDNVCLHDACRPAINFAVELMYASAIFQVSELVSLFQNNTSDLSVKDIFEYDEDSSSSYTNHEEKRRLLNFVGKALVEDVIPILLVAFRCHSSQLLTQCVDRVARSDLDSISIEKELPDEVVMRIKSLRFQSQTDDENDTVAVDPLHEKRIRRIHKALDSDDVELVGLLLTESDITLDKANALHYAAAYCDPKVVSEVLSLGLADVNLRNSRGYTVLHIAAMRKEPSIIVSLLRKGACASELTLDGQSAVIICRRSTRPKDYLAKTQHGQEANKDRICIDVLERETQRNPMAGNASFSSQGIADDLHTSLLSLENRVAFARLFFPTEAKVVMDIANAETISEFAGLLASKGSSGNLREVDLNETPIMQKKRLESRVEALSRTVALGRRFFPHCSQVLDKFLEDDLPDLFYLEKGTLEEQSVKRKRFVELKEDVQKAFDKDKAELHRSGMPPSSLRDGVNNKVRKLC